MSNVYKEHSRDANKYIVHVCSWDMHIVCVHDYVGCTVIVVYMASHTLQYMYMYYSTCTV